MSLIYLQAGACFVVFWVMLIIGKPPYFMRLPDNSWNNMADREWGFFVPLKSTS